MAVSSPLLEIYSNLNGIILFNHSVAPESMLSMSAIQAEVSLPHTNVAWPALYPFMKVFTSGLSFPHIYCTSSKSAAKSENP